MTNIYLVSKNSKLLIKDLKSKRVILHTSPSSELYRSKKDDLEIDLKDIKNVFILNKAKLSKELIKLLIDNRVNIFVLNDMGNIEKIYFNPSGLKPIKFNYPLQVSKSILFRDYYASFYLIKRKSSMYRRMVKEFTTEIAIGINATSMISTLERDHFQLVSISYSMLGHEYPEFQRRSEIYTDKLVKIDSEYYRNLYVENIVINYLNSMFYSKLLEYFSAKGIEPFSSDNLWFDKSIENYPNFLRAFHGVFRIWIARIGLDAYKTLIYPEDFQDQSLNDTAKMIISKLYSEYLAYHKGINDRLDSMWHEISEIEQGRGPKEDPCRIYF